MARWIKIYDGLLEWEWHKRPEMISLFVHLLLMANTKDGRFEGHEVKRGQLVTSIQSLSEIVGCSVRTIRTCLERLEETGEIIKQATNKFTILTICKYEDYQEQPTNNRQTTDKQNDKQSDKQIDEQTTSANNCGCEGYSPVEKQADKQPTSKTTSKTTTNIEYIDIYNNPPLSKESVPPLKKIATMEERAKNFGKQLVPYVETYGKKMIRDFYDYWTGHDEGDTKMAFEKAKSRSKSGVFNIPRRLATWKRMDDEKQTPTPKRMQKGCSIMEALAATGMIGEEMQTDKLIGQ